MPMSAAMPTALPPGLCSLREASASGSKHTLRRPFGLSAAQRGLVVTDVTAGGPSWGELVDPERGGPDIILEVEGKPVKTVGELREMLKGMKPGEIVSLRVYNTQAKNRRIERIKLGE